MLVLDMSDPADTVGRVSRRGLTVAEKRKLERVGSRPDADLEAVEAHLRMSEEFVAIVRLSIREAIDDVIDGRRTRRFQYSDLSSGEKSFCGVRIESALVRNLQLAPGSNLDVSIERIDVDVKASSRDNWMIGPRQLGGILLLIGFSEPKRVYSVGLVRAHREFMNPSNTRDAKRSLASEARKHIRWITRHAELPVSVLSTFPEEAYDRIFTPTARAERVKRFLEYVEPYVPFPRRVIETVVGGTDPLRGTRADRRGKIGATHPLGDIRVLSYQSNGVLTALGLPKLVRGEHMKVNAADL
jgi:hypothetical protein